MLLAVLLVFALFLAPLGISGSADASEHHTHSSSLGLGGNPDHDGSGDIGHGLLHCGSFSCAPSYIAGSPVGFVPRAMSALARMTAGDDPLLWSLYLDCDPPVPRGGFTPA